MLFLQSYHNTFTEQTHAHNRKRRREPDIEKDKKKRLCVPQEKPTFKAEKAWKTRLHSQSSSVSTFKVMSQHRACTCLGPALYLSNQFAQYKSSLYKSRVVFPSIALFVYTSRKWFVSSPQFSAIELCTITHWKNILLSLSECWRPEARFQPKFPPRRNCHSAQFDNMNQWSSCFSSTPAIFCNFYSCTSCWRLTFQKCQ